MTTAEFNATLQGHHTKGRYQIIITPAGIDLNWSDYFEQHRHWAPGYGTLASTLAAVLVQIADVESQID